MEDSKNTTTQQQHNNNSKKLETNLKKLFVK